MIDKKSNSEFRERKNDSEYSIKNENIKEESGLTNNRQREYKILE